MEKKSLFGLEENIVSAIAYAGVFVTGILVYIFERENKTVKFHAMQSTILFAALAILYKVAAFALGWIPLIGWIITGGLTLICVAAWIYLIFTAYRGIMFKVPVLGDEIWKHLDK